VSAADHLLKALRETLRGPGKPRRTAADVALLLASFDELGRLVGAIRDRAARLGAGLAERVDDAEHVATLARSSLARGRDVRGAASAAREALEGVRLLALNSGLEGARISDASSAALIRLSDEVRARAVQGMEALDELNSLLEQLDRDRDKLRDAAVGLTTELKTLEQTSSGDQAAHQGLEHALTELGEAIERATGADPALAPLLASAAEHARGLASSLSQLATRDGAKLALRSLQPILEPLLNVLDEIYGESEEEK
jgi:chromosome segregation ATPase